MKRRSFLRNALLGTTAVAITPSAFLASCDPGEVDPGVIFGNVGGLTVPEPPFVNPIATLNATSAIGASLDAVKNSEILIGTVNPTFCFGYGNGIWGPTLKIRKGEAVNIDVANHINESTNVHFHGLLLNAGEDDGVDDEISNGGSRNYNFTVNNRAGLYWYHPQYGKSAGKQVNIGLGGLFVVEDDEEDGINLPTGDRSMFLVLQDKRFNEDSSMFYGTNTAEKMVGYFGETIMINGVTGALKDNLSQRFYRLRICNASNARIYNLGLDTEDLVDLGFYIIGGDGGLLENVWGAKRFGIFYLICGIGANIINTIVNIIIVYKATGQVFISEADISNSLLDQTYNGFGVGASGAIFGILGAYFVLFPHTKLSLMFPPITLEARIFIPIYVLIELYLATNRFEGDNIGHVAHLGGVFIGYILVKIWNKRSNTFY